MGGCVTPRWIAIGPRQHVKPSAPSFQLVELFKASDSLASTDVKSNESRLLGVEKKNPKTVDWPIKSNVSSRGIVLIISLDKKKIGYFIYFFLPNISTNKRGQRLKRNIPFCSDIQRLCFCLLYSYYYIVIMLSVLSNCFSITFLCVGLSFHR